MSLKIQIIVAVALVLVLILIINTIRRNRMDLRYGLAWLVVLVIVLILDIFPQFMEFLCRLIGVALPINMLFFFGFVFALIIMFGLTMAMSRLSIKAKRLAQELAIMDRRIQELEEAQKTESGNTEV